MASLPQTPAQTGLASILAALGQAAPAGAATETPGFEQLFANLPATATNAPTAANLFGTPGAAQTVVPSTDAAALATPVTAPTPPAAALFGLPQPVAEIAVDAAVPAGAPAEIAAESIVKVSTASTAEALPADRAAAAASLLITVATPFKGAVAANDKAPPAAEAETETETPNDGEATAPVVAALIIQPATVIAETPAAAGVIASAMPTADKPVTEKAPKTAALTSAQRQTDPALLTPATKPAETAQPQPVAVAAAEPKTGKLAIDVGASMTILFAQPDLQGAAPLAEAAKAATVAERVLDLASDDQWIAQLAADIAATKSDKGDISFRLMPRHLGRLDVSMLTGDEGVTLKLDAQHEATATIVSAAQPRLVEDLRQQGVRVAETQVTHTPAETGRQPQNPGQGRGHSPDASHLIETAADQADPTTDERTADRRGRFA
ncbi:flagellar hook-length control protein FliK [Sphingopyxis sp.]|uniref:flagellar hook-length control protein FliK n=1 Tax=Sphingopyxis sp. TaxID=1908224 RepID=UPI003BAB3A22